VKHSILLAATVCSAIVLGCSKAQPTVTVPPPDPKARPIPGPSSNLFSTPEAALGHAESDEERIRYLKSLATDPKFVPKDHKPLLESYAKDPDKDMAAAAQALLDKAQ
jgi:hypothetical protein